MVGTIYDLGEVWAQMFICWRLGPLCGTVERLWDLLQDGPSEVIRSMVAPPQEAIIVIFSGPDQFPRECVLNANQAF
jgi:hypothetical protein